MFRSTFLSQRVHWPTRCSHLSSRHTATEEQSYRVGEVLTGCRNACPQRQRLGLIFLVVFACGLASLASGQEGSSTPQSVEAQKRDVEEVDKLNQRVVQLSQKGVY